MWGNVSSVLPQQFLPKLFHGPVPFQACPPCDWGSCKRHLSGIVRAVLGNQPMCLDSESSTHGGCVKLRQFRAREPRSTLTASPCPEQCGSCSPNCPSICGGARSQCSASIFHSSGSGFRAMKTKSEGMRLSCRASSCAARDTHMENFERLPSEHFECVSPRGCVLGS